MADVRVIKNKMKLTLDFIKQIYGTDKDCYNMIENIIEKQNGDISRLFIILSFAKDVFDLDDNLCHRLLEDNFVCEKLFTVEEDLDFLYLEGILNFFTQYADVLVKLHLETTFEQQHSLLLEVSYLSKKLPPESNPMQWIIRTITSDISTCDMKAKLIGLLPSGDSYKSTWSWYAGLLPARLSEAQGESGVLLAALLEALITADSSLLKTISQLIAGDTATGWWDDAIDACVVSLSKSNDISVYETLYSCCWEGLSLGVCCRLMVPLLRSSTAAVCEEFFSLKLKDLFSILKKKSSSSNRSFSYQMAVVNYIRALILLRVCIEMSNLDKRESLSRSRRTPSISEKLVLFYCENYNSLASAVWCRQPSDPKFYDLVFNKETWCRIIDPQMEYQLPLVESWQKHIMHQFAGVELEDNSCLLSSTSTTRTRTYLRTLSENPEEFDVGMPQDDQECHQELCISENMLNQHPCAGILTMSVSRATSLSHMTWLNTIINTLTTDIHRNIKWLLAQKENSDICHNELFRRIAELLPKMVDINRRKCLEILTLSVNKVSSDDVSSLFQCREVFRLVQEGDNSALVLVGRGLSRLGRGLMEIGRGLVLQSAKHCRSDVKRVREAAYGVLRSAVECLYTDTLESNPKRSARFSSPLLQDEELKVALASLGLELVSDDGLRNAVSSCLPTGILKRFCESFIISVYLPVVYGDSKSMNCLTALLDIFFKDLRDNESFKRNLITEHTPNNLDKKHRKEKKTPPLNVVLQFCKTGEAASALTLQLLTSLQSNSVRGFDFPAAMTHLLLPMLPHIGDITPFVIQACRLFINECCTIQRFKPAVEELLKKVKGIEGEILVQVLLEDVEIRLSGFDYFVLGNTTQIYEDSEMLDLSKEFSLEDVVTSFDSLSNWQLLTLQQQKSAADRLPPLWTCISDFRKHLDSYEVTTTNTWFDKMLSIYQESKKSYKSSQWYNEMSRWPKRQFTISAVNPKTLCFVYNRSACIQKMYEDMESMTSISPSHSHALRWCKRANEMTLPLQVLCCIQTIDKQELTTLAWQRQEILARRQLALKNSDMDILSQLLERAHSYGNIEDITAAESQVSLSVNLVVEIYTKGDISQ
ncbi:hypothetical protein RR48_01266 [Papilio machaon]|uniref:Uncharacterized protein n=1 Tax=Papilio machaon TaxID=76193 RepID=A0A0N1PF57_PAPMA|nr:hypothetical protein RR48_01266 [Papilio machaon]